MLLFQNFFQVDQHRIEQIMKKVKTTCNAKLVNPIKLSTLSFYSHSSRTCITKNWSILISAVKMSNSGITSYSSIAKTVIERRLCFSRRELSSRMPEENAMYELKLQVYIAIQVHQFRKINCTNHNSYWAFNRSSTLAMVRWAWICREFRPLR